MAREMHFTYILWTFFGPSPCVRFVALGGVVGVGVGVVSNGYWHRKKGGDLSGKALDRSTRRYSPLHGGSTGPKHSAGPEHHTGPLPCKRCQGEIPDRSRRLFRRGSCRFRAGFMGCLEGPSRKLSYLEEFFSETDLRGLRSSARGALMRYVGSVLRSVLAGVAFVGPTATYILLLAQ